MFLNREACQESINIILLKFLGILIAMELDISAYPVHKLRIGSTTVVSNAESLDQRII